MGYTVHGILKPKILEWVAVPFSRGSSQPRDQTQVSHIAGGCFTSWATREAHMYKGMALKGCQKKKGCLFHHYIVWNKENLFVNVQIMYYLNVQ